VKGIIPIVAPVIITIALLAGAWQLKLLPLATQQAGAASTATAASGTLSYTMPERVVNLADDGSFHYLKIQITLEFTDPRHHAGELKGDALKQQEDALAADLAPRLPAVEDYLITTLSAKTSTELLKPAGKEALRQQLLTGLQQRLPDHQLRAVYFQQFVIQ
jgi:flagellar basal body-associated protein FliL